MAHLPLWYLGDLPEQACDIVLQEFSLIPPRPATMGVDSSHFDTLHRDTKVRFVENGHWLEKALLSFAIGANSYCEWGYEVDSNEAIQFAEYGEGQHYNWHIDTFPLAGKSTDRKLTVVCLLSDPSEFEGGEFQVRLYQQYTAPLKKGSMIAFPSILDHRVTPVTKGVRKTATMWISGPRFK